MLPLQTLHKSYTMYEFKRRIFMAWYIWTTSQTIHTFTACSLSTNVFIILPSFHSVHLYQTESPQTTNEMEDLLCSEFSLVARWTVSQTGSEITAACLLCVSLSVQASQMTSDNVGLVTMVMQHESLWGSFWRQRPVSNVWLWWRQRELAEIAAHIQILYMDIVYYIYSHCLSFPPCNSTHASHSSSFKIKAGLQANVTFCISITSHILIVLTVCHCIVIVAIAVLVTIRVCEAICEGLSF